MGTDVLIPPCQLDPQGGPCFDIWYDEMAYSWVLQHGNNPEHWTIIPETEFYLSGHPKGRQSQAVQEWVQAVHGYLYGDTDLKKMGYRLTGAYLGFDVPCP